MSAASAASHYTTTSVEKFLKHAKMEKLKHMSSDMIEEKVKAVMMQAKKGGGVGKALGLSIDERGWKEGIGKGKRGGEVEESVDKSMDDTMFSPEAKTTQEREAKMLRRGMRKEEREARGERERRATARGHDDYGKSPSPNDVDESRQARQVHQKIQLAHSSNVRGQSQSNVHQR